MTQENGHFDFEAHVEKTEINYRKVQDLYAEFSKEIERILKVALKGIKVHEFQSRAKTIESLRKKASKPLESDNNRPKYEKPLTQITDLAGVRAITFFPKTIEEIEERIKSADFIIKEHKDVGQERWRKGDFGYQSIHFLVELPENRKELPENEEFRDFVCEIQVRTIMQHAWAEMEHDIQYKSSENIPERLKRRFLSLAGMIEIADREFQAIQDEDAQLKQEVKSSLEDENFASLDESRSERRDDKVQFDGTPLTESIESGVTTRELVGTGRYEEAIKLYTEKIKAEPQNHLLYAGRSKARFLAGDTKGAVSDVDIAIDRVPDDPNLGRLKDKYEEGTATFSYNKRGESFSLYKNHHHHQNDGNRHLRAGKAEEAFASYSQAQSLGWSYAFSNFHKSMARILADDCDGASFFVDMLKIRKDTPMEPNILALRAVIAARCKDAPTSAYKRLEGYFEEDRSLEFDFGWSPLSYLKRGFENKYGEIEPLVLKVFELLEESTVKE